MSASSLLLMFTPGHAELNQLHEHLGGLQAHALRELLEADLLLDADDALLRARRGDLGASRPCGRASACERDRDDRPDREPADDRARRARRGRAHDDAAGWHRGPPAGTGGVVLGHDARHGLGREPRGAGAPLRCRARRRRAEGGCDRGAPTRAAERLGGELRWAAYVAPGVNASADASASVVRAHPRRPAGSTARTAGVHARVRAAQLRGAARAPPGPAGAWAPPAPCARRARARPRTRAGSDCAWAARGAASG